MRAIPLRLRSLLGAGALSFGVLLGSTSPSIAHAQLFASRLQGLGPDAQLVGGVGLGLGERMDNPFLARGRIGLLYAYEPWIFAAGPSLAVGGLSALGFGPELELSSFDGWYADVGVARAQGDGWVTHAAAGFMVIGLEWQHRFDARDEDALILQVRVPFGTWWFVEKKREAQIKQRAALAAKRKAKANAAPTPVMLSPEPAPVQAPPAASTMPEAQPSPSSPPSAASDPVRETGHLRLIVQGDTTGLAVFVDGEPAPTALVGYDLTLAPGEHELVLTRDGGLVTRKLVTIVAGKLLRVEPLAAPQPAPPR